MSHPWFAAVDWSLLFQKKIAPPYKPQLGDQDDVKHFSSEFTEMQMSPDYDQNSQLDQIEG